jgi:hypothetical protein
MKTKMKEKINGAGTCFRPTAENCCPGPKAIMAWVAQSASDGWRVHVVGLGRWRKLEGVSGRAPGKGKRRQSSSSVGAIVRWWKRHGATVSFNGR